MRILIAEDDATSRLLLQATLKKWGHEVIAASDGGAAWDLLQQGPAPAMAILDWMMPKMDGLELCRRLRAREDTASIYVILLTAKSQQEDLVLGLETGADDYITKPFERAELQARINVGLRMAQYRTELAETNSQLQLYATQMESLAEERSRQLIHSERMATVGLLSAGIAHEVNNPTSFISGNAQIIARFWEKIEPVLQSHLDDCEDNAISFVLEEMPKTVAGIHNGTKRIARIVKGLKAFCRDDRGERSPCNLNDCVAESLMLCNNALKQRVNVSQNLDDNLPIILADRQQLEQVLINLFVNAADAMETINERQGDLIITTAYTDTTVSITIEDSGPGIPTEVLDDIWQPFYTTKTADKGTGLGLSIVHGIIENHEGHIAVVNRPEGGARFSITLPAAVEEETRVSTSSNCG